MTSSHLEADHPNGGLGHRTHRLTPLVSAWTGLVALAFFFAQDFIEHGFKFTLLRDWNWDRMQWVVYIGLFVALIAVAIAWWAWRVTYFRLEHDGLAKEVRFISHENKRVLYRRIQSVDISQPLAARPLGLCKLTIDTGGEGNHDLSFLRREQAEELRDLLLERARTHRQATPPAHAPSVADEIPWLKPETDPAAPADNATATTAPAATAPDAPTVMDSPRRLVTRATPKNIIIGALTSGEFVSTVLFLGVYLLVRQFSGEWLKLGYAAAALLPTVTMVFNRIVKEWRFTVESGHDGLRISRGLTDLTTSSLPVDRVHAVRFKQPMLSRPFKLWRVEVTVLGRSGGLDDGDESTVALSVGTWQQGLDVLAEIWPGVDPAQLPLNQVPERAAWFLWWARPYHRWGLTNELAVVQRGIIGREVVLADHSRAQAVRLHQGPWDRKLRLAAVDFALVDGPAQIRFDHLDEQVARELAMAHPAMARHQRQRRAERQMSRPDHNGSAQVPHEDALPLGWSP